jgi:hypothetical protein
MSNDMENALGFIAFFVLVWIAIYHVYLGVKAMVKAVVNYIGSIFNYIVDMVANLFIPL